MFIKLTTENFIKKSKEIHGNKYDYSNTEYINSRTKICIICPIHGEFWQTPHAHLRGQGCPKCGFISTASKRRGDKESFVEKARKIHNDKFDYSKVEYINNHTKVCINCLIHGEFWQKPNDHLTGYGCPKCGVDSMRNKLSMTFDDFIKLAREKRGDFYEYVGKYEGYDYPMLIRCPIHGEFWQTPHNHLKGCDCPSCAHHSSQNENEIYYFVRDELHYENVCNRDRKMISPFELDVYIPECNTAIEYNGLVWHSEKFNTDKYYHLNKLLRCNKKGINLIQIFEDEYLEHKNIVLEKIRHLLNKEEYKEKIYARKCKVKEISKNAAKDFLNKNHIQGFISSTIYLGCYYNDNLISVMTFKKTSNALNKWVLTRCVCDISKRCIGVPGKLFSFFIKKYNPSEVISFADRRWTIGEENNLYIKLGFKLNKVLKPDYHYVVGNKRVHKFNFRKQKLIKKYPEYNLTMDMTENEMAEKLGIYKIWDCGLFKYVWTEG